MLGACVFTELLQTCYRGLANAKTKNAHSLETKSKAKLPIVKMEYCNQILGTINQTPDPQKAKAVHAAIAFTITTFLSFHILSTTTGSSTRNKFGGLHKKNKEKGSSRAGSQEATMIRHPPLNVSKEGRRGSGITGGKAGYNIGRE